MKDLGVWALAIMLFIISPISITSGLCLFLIGQQIMAILVALPGVIMLSWLAIETMRSCADTERAYQKYMTGTFNEEERQKFAEKIGIAQSVPNKETGSKEQ
jgi:hypothetical protein